LRYLASTDLLVEMLSSGSTNVLGERPLQQLAVSVLSFEWILADVETNSSLSPDNRRKWRANLTNLRKQLRQAGGSSPALSETALAHWGSLMLLDLRHSEGGGTPQEMPVEERLVVATAKDLGLIYLTLLRDWNAVLRDDYGLALEEV